MPLIETQNRPAPMVELRGATNLHVSFSEEIRLRVNLRGKTALDINFVEKHPLAVQIKGKTNLSARLFNVGEPNAFLSVALAGKTALDVNLTTRENLRAVFAGRTTLEPRFTASDAERGALQLVVDILPPASTAKTLEQKAKLTVDGAVIPYRSFQYSEPKQGVGANLSVALARLSDRNLITRNSVIKFELGKKISGVWQWTTKFDSGELEGRNYAIGWANNAPTDTLSIQAAGDLNKKLSKTPATDLIVYDASKVTLEQTDFEPLLDTEGRKFETVLLPVVNLSLFDLHQKIFVERCGFASVQTNLPDYPTSRADFGFGGGYLQGVAPLVGQFEPVFIARDNVLWILETSQLLPAGFPTPREITVSNYRGLNLNENYARVDALLVTFSESDAAWDYYTARLDQTTKETGSFGDPDFTRTETTRTLREYRKSSAPALIVKTDLVQQTRATYDHVLNLINRETNQFFYDGSGRQIRTQRRTEALVPNFAASGNPKQLLTVREETATTQYAAHPFEPRRQYQKSFVRQIRGLISVDAENEYLDEPFKQNFLDAHRAGNLADGITLEYGPIKTITQTARPRRDGTVEVETMPIDHVRNVAHDPVSEILTGDVSLNGTAAKQSKILVFAADNAARSTERVEQFAVGELPLAQGVPLARRRLKKKQTKAKEVSFDLIGFDETIERGSIITAIGRGNENLGAFLIEGLFITGEESGAIFETLQGQQI